MNTVHPIFRSLSFRQVIYVLAAAEEGNVTAAARKLNVSQPAISTAIAALEDHFGLKIFVRQPGLGVALTSFGTVVIKEARALRENAYNFAALGRPSSEVTGALTLCTYHALAPYILPRILTQVQKTLPGVSLQYTEADLEGVIQTLRRGAADIGISYDLGVEEDLIVETLYELQPHVICGVASPFARRNAIKLKELHKQKIILLDQSLSAQYVLGLLKAQKAEPIVAARVHGFELQRSLVASNYGVAVVWTLPKTKVAYVGKPLITIPIADKLPQRVVLISPSRDHQRPLLVPARAEIVSCFAPERV
jgi:DNA-binding transcriptional LysR family regulator